MAADFFARAVAMEALNKTAAVQLTPEFAESVEWLETNGDTSKVYVLPDGYLYAYAKEGSSSYTFTADDFTADSLNTNGALIGSGTPNRIATISMIDLSTGTVSVYCPAPYEYIIYYYTDRAIDTYTGKTSFKSGSIDDVLNDTVSSGTNDGAMYCRISLRDSTNTTADLSDRIDEFVSSVIVSQAIDASTTTYAWKSTGHAFVPADYEDRIIKLENILGGVENGTY